jgi:hypothetical protein
MLQFQNGIAGLILVLLTGRGIKDTHHTSSGFLTIE